MSSTVVSLPEYEGGGCQNPRCSGSNKQRVLSVEEVEHVYPVKDKFGWWPLPPRATHVCTVCGFCYEGISEEYEARQRPIPEPDPTPFDVEAMDWTHEDQFEQTVREAVEQFVRAAPDDASADEVAKAVGRHVVGARVEFARDLMHELEDVDGPSLAAEEFM